MKIWVVENFDEKQSYKLDELWEKGKIRILAGDLDWALVEADFETLSLEGFKPYVPKPGAYVDSGGWVVYVDNSAEVVDSADKVIESLKLSDEDLKAYNSGEVDGDELLQMLRMTY